MAVTEIKEVHGASWAERLGSSFKGVLTGLGLFIVAFPLLFWNEGRAVATAKRLAEGAGAVVSVPSDKIDSANEGKLVHVAGRADTKDVLADAQFGVSATAIKLVRKVEIYQWVEHKNTKRVKKGDKTYEETTYTYSQEWCKAPVSSAGFKEAGHGNPPAALPFPGQETYAKAVTLGAFRLSESNVKRIGGQKAYAFPADFKPPEALAGAQCQNGYIYLLPAASAAVPAQTDRTSGSPLLAAAQRAVTNAVGAALRNMAAEPKTGDVRVSFMVVEPHDIALCQRQAGDSFAPWTASDGKTISLQQDGLADAAAMFASAQASNKMWTWIVRAIGFLMLFGGLKSVLGPLQTLVDVVPVLNGVVSAGVSLIAGLVAGACWLLTVGIAWIAYRPLLGIPLVVGAAALIVLAIRKKKAAAAPAPAA